MSFITLTSRFTDQPTRVRPDAITAIVNLDEKPGAFVHVGFSGWAVSVTESPETILAAIADAERGGAAVTDGVSDAEVRRALDAFFHGSPLNWEDGGPLVARYCADMRAALEAFLKARRP